MRLPEQIFNDLDKIDAERAQLDLKEKTLLLELVEVQNTVEQRLQAYKAINKV